MSVFLALGFSCQQPVIWSRPELKVMFVCTANVCRSPLAEGMLRQRLRARRLAGRVRVRSAGTCVQQPGRRPDARVNRLAAAAGFSLGRIRARRLTVQMIRDCDYVLVMEQRHRDDIARLCGVAVAQLPPTVQLLGAYLPLPGDAVEDVPDPYFLARQDFDDLYQLLDSALTGFLGSLEKHLQISADS